MVFLIGYWKTLLDFYRIGFGLTLKPINQLLNQRCGKKLFWGRAIFPFYRFVIITVYCLGRRSNTGPETGIFTCLFKTF